MSYTLQLKVFLEKERGLCMTVTRTRVEIDEDGEKETVKAEKTDSWLPSSLGNAVSELLTEYLDLITEGDEETPLERAAR